MAGAAAAGSMGSSPGGYGMSNSGGPMKKTVKSVLMPDKKSTKPYKQRKKGY